MQVSSNYGCLNTNDGDPLHSHTIQKPDTECNAAMWSSVAGMEASQAKILVKTKSRKMLHWWLAKVLSLRMHTHSFFEGKRMKLAKKIAEAATSEGA